MERSAFKGLRHPDVLSHRNLSFAANEFYLGSADV
jgi:hypothetical protein